MMTGLTALLGLMFGNATGAGAAMSAFGMRNPSGRRRRPWQEVDLSRERMNPIRQWNRRVEAMKLERHRRRLENKLSTPTTGRVKFRPQLQEFPR